MHISINGHLRQFEPANLTLNDLVNTLNLVGKRIAIELNGEIVSRSQFIDTFLTEGDKLEIVGAVGGG